MPQGADYLDRHGSTETKARRLIQQMEQLGFTVTVTPAAGAEY